MDPVREKTGRRRAIQLGLLLGTGLIVQAHMPERKVALLHLVALTMVALGIAYAISGELPFALIGLVIVAVLIWLHPARERLLCRGRGGSVSRSPSTSD